MYIPHVTERKNKGPLKIAMNFDEAIRRVVRVKPEGKKPRTRKKR